MECNPFAPHAIQFAITRNALTFNQSGCFLPLDRSSIRDNEMYSRDAAEGLDNLTFEDKRRWLEVLQTQVELTSQTPAMSRRILLVKPLLLVLAR